LKRAALAIAMSGGMYLFTNNRRYLNLAWQVARFALFSLPIFALLFKLKRSG